MKKNYLLTFIFLLTTVLINAQVTELYFSKYGEGSSNNKFLEIYNGTNAAISLDSYAFPNVSNDPSTQGEYEFWNTFPDGSTIDAGDVFVIAHPQADQTILDKADMTFQFLSNGDDGFALVKGGTHNDANNDGDVDAGEMTGFTILDWLGDWNGRPSGGWDVAGVSQATKDHTLTRKPTVCGPNDNWDNARGTDVSDSEWIVGAIDTGWSELGSFTGCISDPTLSIVTPFNNQVFDATTVEVPVEMSVENFTLSGDDGSGNSDGTGDGYISTLLQETGEADETASFFTTTPPPISVVPGRTYTATAELVDNAGNSLNPAVTASVTFSVSLPCDLDLGTITESCDNVTSGIDNYTTTIEFTGGGTATYTITALDDTMNPIGMIGGDDPSSSATGTISITGVPEGTDFTVNVTGDSTSSCDITRNISSPTCIGLPIYEPFDYTANTDLISSPLWQDASTSSTPNNIQVVANDDGGGNPILDSYYGPGVLPAFVGNMVSLEGGGSDPYIGFSDVTTGTVYASFTFHVTDLSNAADPDGGYFAVFTENGSFRGRLWVVDTNPGEGLTYNLGLSTTSGTTSNIHTGFTANIQEPVFVVLGYDIDNDEAKLWVVPDEATFGTDTPPAADVTLATSSTSLINRFLLRQDSTNETPAIDLDELRIGATWSSVTSDPTASVEENKIDGFTAYPNPVNNGKLFISSNSLEKKQVSIYNVLGKSVLNTTVSGTRSEVNVATLSSGIYILKVVEGTKIATSKLVIR